MMRYVVPSRTPAPRYEHPHGPQAGFALMATLFVVIGVAGVALIALMTMTLSSSRISLSETAKSRETRAADNALESAINMMRMDPTGLLGSVDQCIDTPGVEFASNNRRVTVTATCDAPRRLIGDTPSGEPPAVQLVGPAGYRSGGAFVDTVHWSNDCVLGNPALGSCGPWALGIGSTNYASHAATEFASAAPSFIHVAGEDPADLDKSLTVAGDLRARRGSATMIPPSEDSPAVQVAGSYQQADLGLFAPQGPIDCGISSTGHPWNVIAAQVVDSDEPEGVPTCGSAAAEAAAQDPRAEIEPRPGLGDGFDEADEAATPTCTGGPGGVVELSPGAYGKPQTAALNRLLGGGCPNRTFWFTPDDATTPGAYWFDVDDPLNPGRDLWNSLIIDDPTVRVIFGTPTGGFSASAAAAATFPAACDPSAAGVEVELSPRTTVRHLAGRVALCDRSTEASTSNVPAAVWQAGNADGGWTGAPDPGASQMSADLVTNREIGTIGGSHSLSNPGNAWAIDGAVASATFRCTVEFWLSRGTCDGHATMQARNLQMSGDTTAPVGRLDSLDVLLRARSTTTGFSVLQGSTFATEVTFYRSGATSPTCADLFPYLPDARDPDQYTTLALDLLSPEAQTVDTTTPRCRDVTPALTRTDLQGSGVDVVHRLTKRVGISADVTTTIDVDGFELRAGWDLDAATATPGPGWTNDGGDPGAILTTDGLAVGLTETCTWTFFSGLDCPVVTRSIPIDGFDNLASPHVPTDGPLLRAGVIVTGETSVQYFGGNDAFIDQNGAPNISENSTMQVTVSGLRDTPGGSCVANWPRVPFWGQGVYLDLLDPAVSGTCSSLLVNSEQLIGASATLQVHVERNIEGLDLLDILFVKDYGIRIDSVRLSTVTAGDYTRPRAPMVMTIGGGPSEDSSVNVFGQLSMPRNDLNVRWNGPAPIDGAGGPVALIGGNTILSGVASYVAPGGEAGILCCSPARPAERIVDLVATVPDPDDGTKVVGTARVRISDVGGPGSDLVIEDWSLT